MRGDGFGAGGGEVEADEPFAGDAVAVDFGGGEFPAAGGLQGQIGEIFAGAGPVEFGCGNVAGWVYVDADPDANSAVNGGASFIGDGGQNLVENFTAGGGRFGRRWRVCGGERVRAQGRGRGGGDGCARHLFRGRLHRGGLCGRLGGGP